MHSNYLKTISKSASPTTYNPTSPRHPPLRVNLSTFIDGSAKIAISTELPTIRQAAQEIFTNYNI
jgi:hypothetical protein